MANYNPVQKNFLNIAHLPTWMLVIGYPLYWLEMYAFNSGSGVTSPLVWAALLAVFLFLCFKDQEEFKNFVAEFIRWFADQQRLDKALIAGGLLLCCALFGVAVYAWTLPLHLVQETDFMIYHVMLPRQHLIRESFEFISWSPFDLFLLPIDYAIAPFGLATVFPNKVPQLIFFAGLLLVAIEAVNRKPLPSVLLMFLILGSHGIGVQMGTAMLDLAIAYLLLAAWDSLRKGRTVLFLIEFCFYFWAKPFVPLQTILIAAGLCVAWLVFRIFNKEMKFSFLENKLLLLRGSVGFLALSLAIAGPFIVKSLYHAGTPLFPFAPGAVMVTDNVDQASKHWRSIEETSRVVTERGKAYGHGRGVDAFIKHFWRIAVPEEGVNNRYDYPAGLPFLLVLLPFFYLFIQGIRQRTFNVVHWFAVFYWALWWMTSQQMRFLYISILLMFIAVVFDAKNLSRSLLFCILLALALNLLSVFRAHSMDFGKPYEEMLRPRDRELVRLNREYIRNGHKGIVELDYDYGDVAFAQFPVAIKKEHPPYILATEQ